MDEWHESSSRFEVGWRAEGGLLGRSEWYDSPDHGPNDSASMAAWIDRLFSDLAAHTPTAAAVVGERGRPFLIDWPAAAVAHATAHACERAERGRDIGLLPPVLADEALNGMGGQPRPAERAPVQVAAAEAGRLRAVACEALSPTRPMMLS